MILAGDIGGTKTLVAYFEKQGDRLLALEKRSYPSPEAAGLGEIVAKFMQEFAGQPTAACFGIAGPVRGGRSETPNLPWVVESAELAAQIGISDVVLMNDLESTAWGIGALREDEFVELNPNGRMGEGNAAVIAPGTGLGEAILVWDGTLQRPFASEGGHADFAPRNELEMDLLRYLLKEFAPHVSYERVLAGPGLHRIYQFLRQRHPKDEPGWLANDLREQDPSAVIATNALAKKDRLCEQALDMFVSFYGAEAGNMALRVMAFAGIYIGGGIAPKIIEALKGERFMEAFLDKGRFSNFLRPIPVRVVLNPETALLGAARRVSV